MGHPSFIPLGSPKISLRPVSSQKAPASPSTSSTTTRLSPLCSRPARRPPHAPVRQAEAGIQSRDGPEAVRPLAFAVDKESRHEYVNQPEQAANARICESRRHPEKQ